MGQLLQVFAQAEYGLERDIGRTSRVPRVTSLAAHMDAYMGAGLPS